MKFDYIILTNAERSVLDTEIRFAIASASVDGYELIALAIERSDSEDACKKEEGNLKRILSLLKREGRISFYIDEKSLNGGSTEAEFLKNKYSSFLSKQDERHIVFFVKL